jgi:hypothetical protein
MLEGRAQRKALIAAMGDLCARTEIVRGDAETPAILLFEFGEFCNGISRIGERARREGKRQNKTRKRPAAHAVQHKSGAKVSS